MQVGWVEDSEVPTSSFQLIPPHLGYSVALFTYYGECINILNAHVHFTNKTRDQCPDLNHKSGCSTEHNMKITWDTYKEK